MQIYEVKGEKGKKGSIEIMGKNLEKKGVMGV